MISQDQLETNLLKLCANT